MPLGYNGKILRVDLTTGQISVDEHDEVWYRTYMGGACFGAYYLLNEMPAHADPYGPDNILVFATSIVVGAPASGYNRFSVIGKSGLTGLIGDTQASGYFGPELKFAGYDAIVVKGISPKPVYLWIHDGEAELRDASHLWGQETKEVQEAIRAEHGDKLIRVAQIGIGGENLVRYACVTNDLNHFNGRTGMGAVMGSKKLKAIAVRGHKRLELKDPKKISDLARYFAKTFMENPANRGHNLLGTSEILAAQNADGHLPTRNFHTGQFEGAEAVSGETMHEKMKVKNESCWACATRCKRVVDETEPYRIDPAYGGPEYEGMAALASNTGTSELAAMVKANELCNRHTLDCISTGMVVSFAMECFENGILTKEDTGGLDLSWGNGESMLKLIEMIVRREGIGDVLAEGVMRAAARIGKGSEKYALHWRGQELPMHDPRYKGSIGLAYSASPIGADHCVAEHDTDFTFDSPQVWMDLASPLGVLRRLPVSTLDNAKIRNFYNLQLDFSMLDTICACIFDNAPVRHYKLHELVEAAQATTGWELSAWELMKAGERRLNMFRLFNLREESPIDRYWLPERMFEPIETGPRAGLAVDRAVLREALAKYFEMLNWDEGAVPREMKLAELDLDWLEPIARQYRGRVRDVIGEVPAGASA